jgi:hypothetical protein
LIWIKCRATAWCTLSPWRTTGGGEVSDFCYGRPMLERVFRRARLMDAVMRRAGIDPVAAARLDRGMAFYEARTRCIDCRHEAACHAWLANTAPSQPPTFCANAGFFRFCQAVSLARERESGSARERR